MYLSPLHSSDWFCVFPNASTQHDFPHHPRTHQVSSHIVTLNREITLCPREGTGSINVLFGISCSVWHNIFISQMTTLHLLRQAEVPWKISPFSQDQFLTYFVKIKLLFNYKTHMKHVLVDKMIKNNTVLYKLSKTKYF